MGDKRRGWGYGPSRTEILAKHKKARDQWLNSLRRNHR